MNPSETPTSPPRRVLFVCSGNTCRSPMAEILARSLASSVDLEPLEIRSAGTHARSGLPASEGARRVVERHGYSLDQHRSASLTPELVEWADVILAMSTGHLEQIRAFGGSGKAHLLGRFAQGRPREGDTLAGTDGDEDLSVPDPFGGDDQVYEETFLALGRYLQMALSRMAEDWNV